MGINSYSFFKEISKNFLSYGVVGVISRFIGFFTAPIYTRIFAPSDYGILETVTLTIAILSLFGTLQLESSFLRFFYDNKDKKYRKKVFSTGLFGSIPLILLLTFTLLLLPDTFSRLLFKSTDYTNIFIIAIIRIPFKIIMGYCSLVLRVEFKRKTYVKFHASFIFLSTILGLIFVVGLGYRLLGLLAVQTAVTILYSFISIYIAREYISKMFSWNLLKEMLKFGLPILPSSLATYAQQYLNRGFILVLYSMFSMGIFSIAAKVSMPLMLGVTGIKKAWQPYAYDIWKDKNSKTNFNNFLSFYVGIVTIIVISIAYFSKEIILIFATIRYIDSANLVGFVALSFALQGITGIISVGLGIIKKPIYNTYSIISGLCVASVFMYLLAKDFNLLGIAIGTFAGELTRLYLTALFVKKKFPGYFSYKKVFIIIFITTIFLILILIFPNLSIGHRLPIILLFILIVYFLILKKWTPQVINGIINIYHRRHNKSC